MKPRRNSYLLFSVLAITGLVASIYGYHNWHLVVRPQPPGGWKNSESIDEYPDVEFLKQVGFEKVELGNVPLNDAMLLFVDRINKADEGGPKWSFRVTEPAFAEHKITLRFTNVPAFSFWGINCLK